MTILYYIKKMEFINIYKNKIKIFGQVFVENNKNNCYLLIDGKKNELSKYLLLNENQRQSNILEIKLIETKIITDMSNIFYDCTSLKSLPDISKWNTKNVTNMSNMFHNCESLISLSDISKWDTKNVNNMSGMFFYCESLEFLPDISE